MKVVRLKLRQLNVVLSKGWRILLLSFATQTSKFNYLKEEAKNENTSLQN